MGPIKLDSRITGQMKTWGGNYDSNTGQSHNSSADTVSKKITAKDITLNVMGKMDVPHPKTDNPGVDKAFLAKSKPSMDTTGHGKLTRNCKD